MKREELDFTLLDAKDRSPIGYRKVNKRTGQEVPAERITRGFQHRKGRYVIVSDDDLRRASPERTQRIDILSFTDPGDVEPIYYDHPYYLAPIAKNEKGYALLREALRRTGKVAIATVVIRTRQYLATVGVHGSVLVVVLRRFASELRDPSALGVPGNNLKALGITDKENRKRAKDGRVEEAAAAPVPAPKRTKGEVIDLMALLKQSVERRGAARGARRRPSARARRSA